MLCSGILFGLCVFAFAAPAHFAKWWTPFYIVTRRSLKENPGRYDDAFSYTLGSVFFALLLGIQFVMGGFFVTGVLDLWASPFAMFFIPH